jgi:hypothetical protein
MARTRNTQQLGTQSSSLGRLPDDSLAREERAGSRPPSREWWIRTLQQFTRATHGSGMVPPTGQMDAVEFVLGWWDGI